MKSVTCANCGATIPVYRKAALGRIYDLILKHECIAVVEPEPAIQQVTIQPKDQEFVHKLDKLSKKDELKDQRPPEHVREKSPTDLLDKIRGAINAESIRGE